MSLPVPWNWPPINNSGDGSGGGDLRPQAWMAQAPESPDDWDFDATLADDPDLSASGWTVKYNSSPYTVLTRSGDIQDPALGTSPAVGTYWSTLINGRLVMRFENRGIEIFKESSGPYTYKFHISPANWDGPLVLFGFVANGTNFDQAGNSIAYTGRENATVIGVSFVGPATFVNAFNAADPTSDLNVDRLIYLFDAGTGVRGVGVSFRYPNGVFWRSSLTPVPAAFDTAQAGVLFSGGNASGPNWLYVDSLRRLPPTEFI